MGWLSRITPMGLFIAAVFACIVVGLRLDTARFLTPESGLGYGLGIVGGSAMLLLLVYPVRKRIRALAPVGSVKAWFRLHMVLGLAGPLLILFHSNFSTGAVNSNVALFCMLVVSGSGIVGRYLYSRIHVEFYGRKATLADLRASAERMQQVSLAATGLQPLLATAAAGEQALLEAVRRVPYPLRPLLAWLHSRRLRRDLRRAAATALGLPASAASHEGGGLEVRQLELARIWIDRRTEAVRQLAAFEAHERLFALWHVLHLPLFFMLIIAGVVHVIAVHVY